MRIHQLYTEFQMHIVHHLPLRFIVRWQDKKLRRLVRHALEHIPLYRSLYLSLPSNVTIDGAHSLVALPIVSKSTFVGVPPEECTDSSRPRKTEWRNTPHGFSVLTSEVRNISSLMDFARFRCLVWRGYSLSRVRTLRVASFFEPEKSRTTKLSLSPSLLKSDPGRVGTMLRSFHPDVLEVGHEEALAFTEYMLNLRIPCILIQSVGLEKNERIRIEKALSGEVFEQFRMEEFGPIATECEVHDGLHINSENFIVEIVDENSLAQSEGNMGRVVVTDLFNFEMPFIRYDTGARGRASSEICSCGLRTPRIWIEHTANHSTVSTM